MDMTNAYREVGTYRGAAAMCGCDPKTIKRALTRLAAGDVAPERKEPVRNYDAVRDVVVARVDKTSGRISAKRLLPEGRHFEHSCGYGVLVPCEGATEFPYQERVTTGLKVDVSGLLRGGGKAGVGEEIADRLRPEAVQSDAFDVGVASRASGSLGVPSR